MWDDSESASKNKIRTVPSWKVPEYANVKLLQFLGESLRDLVRARSPIRAPQLIALRKLLGTLPFRTPWNLIKFSPPVLGPHPPFHSSDNT